MVWDAGNRGAWWALLSFLQDGGGEFWHEVCVVVGVVVGQGLMSVFVGVFSMFSGCPPPISQETISNIA